MPPKVRITRQEIISAAVDLVRSGGADALNARSIAAALQCSTQPVFSNFTTMEELRQSVICAAEQLFQQFLNYEIESGQYPPYKASGMADIRFAKEETQLFRLLYMRDRTAENVSDENTLFQQMTAMVHSHTRASGEHASLFHLEMWSCVHGIAAMIATGYLELDSDLISQMITDVFQGLKKRYEEKE